MPPKLIRHACNFFKKYAATFLKIGCMVLALLLVARLRLRAAGAGFRGLSQGEKGDRIS
jgi:hypothetical protein